MIQTSTIDYQNDGTALEGFVAFDSQEKRPLVLLSHAWRGRDEFICEKAQLMARAGYVGFALDMYGKGVIGQSKEENAALKAPFIKDRHLLQKRILKGFETASSLPYVDTTRIAVLGFGFGGTCALDLARTGVALRGAISVYGHFEAPRHTMQHPIQAKILVLHGYNDPFATMSELLAFQQEMTSAHVDWQTHIYSNTVHAFANPHAHDPQFGTVYNELSTQRAWASIENFLEEIFSNT